MWKWFKKQAEVKELQVSDYPRGQYSAYWEVFKHQIPGGFTAEIRVYSDAGMQSHIVTAPSHDSLQKQINGFLTKTMKQYKRV